MVNLTEVKKFYSDGIAHTNQEICDYFDRKLGKDLDGNRYHNIRGIQQTLKSKKELVNVKRGVWQAVDC